MKTVIDFIFLGSKITEDSDCSCEIKSLAPWKKRKGKGKFTHQLFVIPWIVAYQTLLFMEFSRHEYWSRLAFSSLGIFPTQGSNPPLLSWQVDLLLLRHSVIHAVIPSLPLKYACGLFCRVSEMAHCTWN